MLYNSRFTIRRAALFALFLLPFSLALAATLTVPVADLTQGNVNNRRLTLTSTDSPRQSGAALITVEPKTQFTDSNGTTTFTNVLWGNYRLDIAGTPGTAFRFFVPDTNATLSVLTLITNHTAPNPATNFWTAAQTAAAIAAGGRGAGIVTNGHSAPVTIYGVIFGGEESLSGSLAANYIIDSDTFGPYIDIANTTLGTQDGNALDWSAKQLIGNWSVTGSLSGAGIGPTNFYDLTVSNSLTIGTGSNAATLTVTNGDTLSLPMKWLVDEIEASSITVNGDRITSWQSIFTTNFYSGFISSPILPLITTNGVAMSGTNRIILGTVPTFTSATITGYTNVFTAGSIPPLPDYRIEVSTNGGADWFQTQESVLVTNMVSFYDGSGASSGGGGGNIVIYGYATADYIGNTVDLAGQTIYVDDPTNSRAAANLNTAQAQAAAAAALWGTHTATAKPNLAGFGLNLDRVWAINHVSVSNATRLTLGPYGESLLSFSANPVPVAGFGSVVITNTAFTSSNLTLLVDSKNVVAALIPQFVTNVTATNWADVASYTTTWPLATNGLFTLVIPTTSNTFYRVRMATNATYTATRLLSVGGSLAVTNGIIHPSLSGAPTLTQIGATNVWFTWASNGTPPLLVGSYYNAASNIVSKTLAP